MGTFVSSYTSAEMKLHYATGQGNAGHWRTEKNFPPVK